MNDRRIVALSRQSSPVVELVTVQSVGDCQVQRLSSRNVNLAALPATNSEYIRGAVYTADCGSRSRQYAMLHDMTAKELAIGNSSADGITHAPPMYAAVASPHRPTASPSATFREIPTNEKVAAFADAPCNRCS